MSEQSDDLKERTKAFAVNILRLVEEFPRTIAAQKVAGQLSDSATSVAANYRAVCGARSDNEFVAKLCIVTEEADETVYWLEVAGLAGYVPTEKLAFHKNEAGQLRAIFAKSLKTIRSRLKNEATQRSRRNKQMTK